MSKIYLIGRIYSIRSLNTDKIYIGSTFNSLHKRFASHKSSKKKYDEEKKGRKCMSYEILECGDAYIELIEQYENLTKEELNKHEGEHIRKNQCVNKVIPKRTQKEYRKDNAEKIKQQEKEYRKNHKEHYHQLDILYREKNKEKIKNYQAEYSKKYREKNKEKLAEQKRQYYKSLKEAV